MKRYRDLVMRCPRLGGEVQFPYCERESGDLPCRQIVSCWEAAFPVETYLRETLGADVWEDFCNRVPKDRLTTLIDLVEAAKKRRKE